METNTNSNLSTVYNILFAADLGENVSTLVRTKLEDDCHIRIGTFSQTNNLSYVENQVKAKAFDVVVCKEDFSVEGVSKPIGQGTIRSWESSNPNIRIILIVDDAKRSGRKLESLYEYGFYNCFYIMDLDNNFNELAKLITHGRTQEEAYDYYGMEAIGKPRPSANTQTNEMSDPASDVGAESPAIQDEPKEEPSEQIMEEQKAGAVAGENESADKQETVSNEQPYGMPNQQMYGYPQGMPNQQMYGYPQGMPNQQMYGYPQGMPNQQMYGYPQGMPMQGTMAEGAVSEPNGMNGMPNPLATEAKGHFPEESYAGHKERENADSYRSPEVQDESKMENTEDNLEPSVEDTIMHGSDESNKASFGSDDIYKNMHGAFAESVEDQMMNEEENGEDNKMNQTDKDYVVEPSYATNRTAVAAVSANYESSVTPQEGYVVSAVSDTVLIVEIPGANFLSRKEELRRMPINLITPRM